MSGGDRMASESAKTVISYADWGNGPNDETIKLYTLTNRWIDVRLTNYGARLVSIKTADRNGKMADVILGYDSVADYLADKKTFLGGIVGRYGNRIAHGAFRIGNQQYRLAL